MFENRDGWWNKYIKNTGPVEYHTYRHAPHWQCTKCEFSDGDIPARSGMIIGRDERKDLCRIVDDESIFQRPFDIHKLYVTERKEDE